MMDYEKVKIDQRVRYTKKLLRSSLMELMKEKPINRITTTELCRKADINRNTFYKYYDSPEALLLSIEEEVYAQIKHRLENLMSGHNCSLITQIFDLIIDNSDLCHILFSDYGNKEFIKRVTALPHDKTVTKWRAAGLVDNEEIIEMLYIHHVNGALAVLQYWVQDGMKKSPQEIVTFLVQANRCGTESFLKKM